MNPNSPQQTSNSERQTQYPQQTSTPIQSIPQTHVPPFTNMTPQRIPPQIPQSQQVVSGTINKSKKKLVAVIAGLSFLIISLLLGTGILIAYEKIPVGEKIQKQVANIVFKIPFIPRTPQYVFAASVNAHQNVRSAKYNTSFAIQGLPAPLPEPFSSFPLEISIDGSFDYNDIDNPKSTTNFNIANQFGAEGILINNKIYFQITKIPGLLLGFLNIADESMFDSLLNQWVYYDTTQLNTDARRTLISENADNELEVNEEFKALMTGILREDLLPKVIMTDDTVDDIKTHKMVVDLTAEELPLVIGKSITGLSEISNSLISERLSEISDSSDKEPEVPEELKLTRISLWIDRDTFYLRKAELYLEIEIDDSSPSSTDAFLGLFDGNPTMKLVWSLTLSDHGESIEIMAPDTSMPLEEYIVMADRISDKISGIDSSFSEVSSNIQLLATSTDLFKAINNRHPNDLNELVVSEIAGKDINEKVLENDIKYLVTTDRKTVIIYSTIEDSSNYSKPFSVFIISQTIPRENKNMSGENLNSLLKSLGLPEDSGLGCRIFFKQPITLSNTTPC